jgi:hypothetical protein
MPAGSTYTPIATTTLGSNAASYTFTAIPSTYTDLVLVVTPLATSNGQATYIRVGNGSIDSGSNYSNTNLSGNGSIAISARRSNATEFSVEYYTAADTTARDNIIVHFMNYSNTTTNKTFISRSNNAAYGVDANVGLWRSTSAINQIFIASGAYAIGSTFTLYGLAAA